MRYSYGKPWLFFVCAAVVIVCTGGVFAASALKRAVGVGTVRPGNASILNLRPKTPHIIQSQLLGKPTAFRLFKPLISSPTAGNGGIPKDDPRDPGPLFGIAELVVSISPSTARNAGARWRLEGNEFKQSGETIRVAPGTYRLDLSEVNGLEAPKSRRVLLVSGRRLELEVVYGTPEPVISTSTLRVAGVGLPYVAPIEVLNLPTSVAVSGLGGTGLEFDPQLRRIRGTPALTGTFPIHVTATNAGGSDERDFTLEVRNTATLQLLFDPALGRTSAADFPRTLIVPLGTFQEITARPERGIIFAGWSGTGIEGLPIISPTLAFTITGDVSVNAQFIGNPFPPLSGRYSGLLMPTLGSPENAGVAQVRVSRAGAFTAAVTIGGKRNGLIGSFAGDGSARGKLKLRRTGPELAVLLNLDVSGAADQITVLLEGPETRIEGVAQQID